MTDRRASTVHAIDGLYNATQAEKDVLETFGGWGSFMDSYGLKALNSAEEHEGQRILRALAQAEERKKVYTEAAQEDWESKGSGKAAEPAFEADKGDKVS